MKGVVSHLIGLIVITIFFNACHTLNLKKENHNIIKHNKQEIKIQDEFLKKIWKRAQKISGIYSKKFPEINFIEFDPRKKNWIELGYHGVAEHDLRSEVCRISIYYGDLLMRVSYFDQERAEMSVYNTIGHENLHCLYYYKGIYHKKENHHCRMIETGNLEKLIDFIQKNLEVSSDSPKEKSLNLVKLACRKNR